MPSNQTEQKLMSNFKMKPTLLATAYIVAPVMTAIIAMAIKAGASLKEKRTAAANISRRLGPSS